MDKGIAVVQVARYRVWFDTTNSYIDAILYNTKKYDFRGAKTKFG